MVFRTVGARIQGLLKNFSLTKAFELLAITKQLDGIFPSTSTSTANDNWIDYYVFYNFGDCLTWQSPHPPFLGLLTNRPIIRDAGTSKYVYFNITLIMVICKAGSFSNLCKFTYHSRRNGEKSFVCSCVIKLILSRAFLSDRCS